MSIYKTRRGYSDPSIDRHTHLYASRHLLIPPQAPIVAGKEGCASGEPSPEITKARGAHVSTPKQIHSAFETPTSSDNTLPAVLLGNL